MSERRIAAICASSLFVVLLALALMAADKPPPVGFLRLVAALAVLTTVVFLRLRVYLRRRASRERRLIGQVAIEGIVAGALVALALGLIGSGEPSIEPSVRDRAIGVGISSALGAFLALTAYATAALMQGSRLENPTSPT